ncbi:MAG: PilZ domain-containing protein [Gammaproteobacteria bacterium]|jgi:hypothetical protein
MKATETEVKEHRSKNRIEVSEVIQVIDRQTGNTIGQLVNISEEGLMLQGPEPVPENGIYQLSLEFDANSASAADGPLMIGVESLWCHSSSDQAQHWSGFYIIDISEQDLQRIRQLAS